jgi:hypothetical protein
MSQDLVHWTLPRWAADLCRETLICDSNSASFDPSVRKKIARALRVIVETGQDRRLKSVDAGFDLFRLSKSKEVVDVSANTLRSYNREGLPFYKQGKAIFVSKTELAAFIRFQSQTNHTNETD